MKQIWPNYSYSPTTNVLTLTGLNIDRDQLLLVTAADRGRIMYNFADSSVTASAFTSGANTALTLVATTAGLTTTAALVIYYDDQLQSTAVSISNLPATQTIAGTVTIGNLPDATIPKDWQTIGDKIGIGLNAAGLSVDVASIPAISGTVTASNISSLPDGANNPVIRSFVFGYDYLGDIPVAVAIDGQSLSVAVPEPVAVNSLPDISGTVTIGSALPAGTNRIGVVTIGGGTVTIGAGTAQIGSVTASISGTVPVSGTFWQATQPASLASLPALAAGTAQIGSVTASISNSVVTFYPMQGTSVSNTNFTSTTSSTTLVSAVAGREVLTVFNEGAGNLHISAGATCTTISYQVRLSAGDYWECPQGQLSLAHTAVFATAGTARVTQVS